jgi:two-component system, probable response regulator PhcQ
MKTMILLVDDEINILSALSRALFDEDYEIETRTNAEDALAAMGQLRFKVVISDECMVGMQGSEFLARVQELYPETIRILLTGHATLEAAIQAVNAGGIYRFFTKPWDDMELKFAIRSAIERYDLEAENRRLLKTIRQQALAIKVLEKQYPGISRLEKDSRGNFVLPDMPEEEIARLIAECENEAG